MENSPQISMDIRIFFYSLCPVDHGLILWVNYDFKTVPIRRYFFLEEPELQPPVSTMFIA